MKRINTQSNYCVYMHVNKINGKKYIGQTYNLKERWRCKGKNYSPCIKFFNAIKKYGWDNFEHVLIKEGLSRAEADNLEKELIKKYNTIKEGYNLKEGGSRGELSPESLKKMGDSVRRGFKEHPERAEKIRQKAIGRKVSDETKRKISINRSKIILINIDGEIGSIRYWAGKIEMTHPPLLRRKKKYGLEAMI